MVKNSISFLGPLHVLIHFADGDQEIELVRKDNSGEKNDEANVSSVLKVRYLGLARSELNPPTDGALRRWWLEAHRLPVGRLQILPSFKLIEVNRSKYILKINAIKYLKMIGIFFIVLMDFFTEERNRITDEEMSNVLCQKMIDTGFTQLNVGFLVDNQWDIIVSSSKAKI